MATLDYISHELKNSYNYFMKRPELQYFAGSLYTQKDLQNNENI